MKFQGNMDRQVPSVRRFHHQDLQTKADELEVLFAAHKLRINAANSLQSADEVYGRGELYASYMKRRDAKLRRDWELKREEKETNLSALELKFDQMVADLQANLYGVTDNRLDSVMSGPKRMERHRSFNSHSMINRNKESLIDPTDIKEDEDFYVSLDNRFKGHGRMFERSLSLSGRSESASEKQSQQPNYPISRNENSNLPRHGVGNKSRGATFSKSKSTSLVSSTVREDYTLRSRSLRKSSGLASELIPMKPPKFGDKNMLLNGKFSKQQDMVPPPYLQNKKVEVSSSRNMKEPNYRFDNSFDRRQSWSGQAQVFQSRIPAPSPQFKPREDRRVSIDSMKGQRSLFSLSSFRSQKLDLKSSYKGW